MGFFSFLKTAEASLITTIINTNTMSSPCIVRWCFWNEASLKRQVQIWEKPIKVKMGAVDRYFLNVKDKWTKEPAILILKSQRWWTGDEGIYRFMQIVFSIPMRKPKDFQNSCKSIFPLFWAFVGDDFVRKSHVLNVFETLLSQMAGNYGSFSFEVPFYTSVLGVGQDPADVSVESFNVETLGPEKWKWMLNNLQVNFGWISHNFTWDLWSIEDFHGWKMMKTTSPCFVAKIWNIWVYFK